MQICFIRKVMSSGNSQYTVLIDVIGIPRLPATEVWVEELAGTN